jgi:hypothetical protein
MNKEAYLEEVYNESFNAELEKLSGTVSEAVGAAGWFPAPSAVGGAAGLATGGYKSKKEYKAAQKKGASNVLLPGVGAYRLARKARTKDKYKK